MLAKLASLTIISLPFRIIAFPYPILNSSTPAASLSADNITLVAPSIPLIPLPTTKAPQLKCESAYTSDLTVLNQRYPVYNMFHLYSATQLFMLRRQTYEDGTEIASHVQFYNLPSFSSNKTCRLEFLVPPSSLQKIAGSNPSFDIFLVSSPISNSSTPTFDSESEPESRFTTATVPTPDPSVLPAPSSFASWRSTFGNPSVPREYFSTVNGETEALRRTRTLGSSVAAVNATQCQETMTFWMRVKYDGEGGVPNYWEFVNTVPPAWPVMGWRMVWGC